jgi:sugar lactone lactonase YvrE
MRARTIFAFGRRFEPGGSGKTTYMRKLALLAGILAAALLTAAAVAGKGPERIALPDGFRPEGISAGKGKSVYVGSIPTGQVLRINTKTGASDEAVPARDDHAAIGLKYERRTGRLFVSGGPTGKAFVYDASDGSELAAFQLTPGQDTFINDVVLTRGAAYFTDSRQPVIYRVARDLSGVTPVALDGFPMVEGLNLNGIEAARRGRVLLAIQGGDQGILWRIDPATGAFSAVDLQGAELTAGDGLLFIRRRTLLVVQNELNRIAVVKLNRSFTAGRIVRTITHPDFDVPTTVARKRGSLFLPNARFSTEPTPETEYWVTRVGKR